MIIFGANPYVPDMTAENDFDPVLWAELQFFHALYIR